MKKRKPNQTHDMQISIKTTIRLNNGVKMPAFGLGLFEVPRGITERLVSHALQIGYRRIDTASIYGNEEDVGRAIAASRIPRKNIFVTTKLWNSDHGPERTVGALYDSLTKLRLDYVDLYLIHWPVENLRQDTWRIMIRLLEQRLCRAIGVSNYTVKHLKELLKSYRVAPAINQVEFSPFLFQKDLLDFCIRRNIQVEAYSPLTQGRKLGHPTLKAMSKKYGKTPAQILIRWALQHSLAVIPKSAHTERICENADVFDFNIALDDLTELDRLDEGFRANWDPSNVR